jgi:hypothetical protein
VNTSDVLSLTAGGSVEVLTVYSGIKKERPGMCNLYTVREQVRFLSSPALWIAS